MGNDQIRLAQQASCHLTNVRFIPVDGTRLPFDDGEFDIVFTNKVTHHIPNWLEAVAEMAPAIWSGTCAETPSGGALKRRVGTAGTSAADYDVTGAYEAHSCD